MSLRLQRFDAFISHNFCPVRFPGADRCRRGVFIHDVIFLRTPQWFTLSERLYLGPILRLTRWFADSVLTSSRNEGLAISQALDGRPVVPVGLSLPLDLSSAIPTQPKMVLEGPSFLLVVGRLNKRKNVGPALKALVEYGVVTKDLPVVVVGAADGKADSFEALADAVTDRSVIFAGRLTSGELRWLYERARLLIFPSLDEGFGMPIIEAASFGTPIACSDIPVFREIVGENGNLFDPRDNESIASVCSSVLSRNEPNVLRWSVDWPDVASKIRAEVLGSYER